MVLVRYQIGAIPEQYPIPARILDGHTETMDWHIVCFPCAMIKYHTVCVPTSTPGLASPGFWGNLNFIKSYIINHNFE